MRCVDDYLFGKTLDRCPGFVYNQKNKEHGLYAFMDYFEENLHNKSSRGIYTVGVWLLISTAPGFYWLYQMGEKAIFSHVASVVGAYNMVALLCGLGLFFKRDWARRGAVWLFAMMFIWALVVVYWFLGPSIKPLAFWLTDYVELTPSTVQKILFALFIAYILWPVMAFFYLTYPGVKIQFQKKPAGKSRTKKIK